jgi:hypothetical protein
MYEAWMASCAIIVSTCAVFLVSDVASIKNLLFDIKRQMNKDRKGGVNDG